MSSQVRLSPVVALWSLLVALPMALGPLACSDDLGHGSTSSPASCKASGDCASGQVCVTNNGDPYCANLCRQDSQCPKQIVCEGPQSGGDKAECDDIGDYADGQGACDLYDGSYGPRTCGDQGSGGSGSSMPATCTKDADCGAGLGCKVESSGDSYCASLCTQDSQCPKQIVCDGTQSGGDKAECDDIGEHASGQGVCDLYDGSYGPKTCGK